jgi:cation diffusion facilitator CzcD-associated flavoprotein CzcO
MTHASSPTHRIVIVGAGFAGMCMGIKLKEAGIHDFVILESGDDVGGTWRDNTYPGCACDVPSHLYSYSFEQNPDWSRMYGPQPEIWDYMRRVARKYGIYPHCRFGDAVTRARWDEAEGVWIIRTAKGHEERAQLLVSGIGGLTTPSYPAIDGMETFGGAAFHSARWDHSTPIRGQRVAVVGTGASAIQIVPTIAPDVAQLTLYQRTAPWVLPKPDGPIPERMRSVLRRFPAARVALRELIYTLAEVQVIGFLDQPWMMDYWERQAREHLARQVPDPELRAKLTPKFRMGCKRRLYANDYYPALQRDNVEVVTDGIARMDATGIVTADGRHRDHDVVVYSTGFKPGDISHIEVLGRGGRDLNAVWRERVEAYWGINIAGFPNYFMLLGPNTGLGHNSIILMIEAQVQYTMECIRAMRDRNLRTLEVKPEAQRKFNAEIDRRLAGTVWQSGCESWYLDRSGHNYTIWPGSTWDYARRTRKPNLSDFAAA